MMILTKLRQMSNVVVVFIQTHLIDLFVYSVPITYTALVIEQLRSFGFLSKLSSGFAVIMSISLVSGLLVWQAQTLAQHEKVTQLYYHIRYVAAALVFIFLLMVSVILQRVGFFSQKEINLSVLTLIYFYTGGLLLLPKIAGRQFIQTVSQLLAAALVLFVVTNQFSPFVELLINRTERAKDLLPKSHEERLESLWGFIVPYFAFVRATTTEDARILHAAQKYPWPETGNQYVVRRFLYPRTLVAPEWGKGDFEWALVDDGSTYIHTVSDTLAGWPTMIIPTEKVIRYQSRTKEVQVLGLSVNSLPLPLIPEASQSADSQIRYSLSPGQLHAVATYSAVVSDTLWLDQEYQLSDDVPIDLVIQSPSSFSARLAMEFVDGLGRRQQVLSATNETANQIETITMPNPFTRIRAFETRNNQSARPTYAVRFGIDVGSPRAMAYLEGKGLLKVDRRRPEDFTSCTGRECLTLVEHLMRAQQFQLAYAQLQKNEPLMIDDPYFNYLMYLALQGLNQNQEVQSQLLQKAGRFWATEIYYNLPRHIISKSQK